MARFYLRKESKSVQSDFNLLQGIVLQTLDGKGVLAKLRAQLRQHVYEAIAEVGPQGVQEAATLHTDRSHNGNKT